MKFPHVEQHDEKDCGAACLSMICEYFGSKYKIAHLREIIGVDNQGANIYGLVTGAESIGFNADALSGDFDELMEGIDSREITFPFIARIVNEFAFEHYIVVYGIKNGRVIVGDPGRVRTVKLPIDIFKEQWQGQIVTFEPGNDFKAVNERKGFIKKYFKYITNQKKILALVFVFSIIVTLINASGVVVFEFVLTNSLSVEADVHDDIEDSHVSEIDDGHGHEHEHEHTERVKEEHSGDGHNHETEEDYPEDFTLLDKIIDKLFIIFDNLKVVCLSVIGLYLLRIVVSLLRGYILAVLTKKVDVSLTLDYYNHLLDLPAGFYGTRKTGEYMSRFSDADRIRNAIYTSTLTIMLDTIMVIGSGVLLCFINVKLFWVTLVIVAIYAIIVVLFRKPIKNVNYQLMEENAQITSYIKENIDGIETVKAYQYEPVSKNNTKERYLRFAGKNVKASMIYQTQDALISAVYSIGIVVILWVGAYLCIDGAIDMADLIMFYYLIGYFLNPVENLINLQPQLQTAAVAAERLDDILDVEKESDDGVVLDKIYGDISFSKVDFRYGKRALVLNDVSMRFAKNKKTAIVGESGCGKTTIVKLLMAFYKPEKGEVKLGDTSLFEYSIKSLRDKIAYVSQNTFIFSDSVYNNLRMGDESITDDQIKAVCKECMADEFIMNMPFGYDTVLEENGNNLSGGQKQRLAIARALLRNPDVIIMDEMTSNMDMITEKYILETIDRLSKDKTCIIIAHRLSLVKSCDYIYVMEKGEVVQEGTHENLLEEDGMYKELCMCE